MPDVPTPPTGWTEHTAHRGMYSQPNAGPQTYKENSHTQIGLHTTTIISSQYTHRATAGPDSANARWETVRSYVQGGAGEALLPCAENIHCSIETSRAAPRQHASAVRIGKDTRLFPVCQAEKSFRVTALQSARYHMHSVPGQVDLA